MAYAITRVHEEIAARVFAGHKSEVVAESLALCRAAVDARVVGPVEELTNDEAARLIVSLDLWGVRDELLTWFDGDRGDATRTLLLELVRRSVMPGDAAALTVFAWVCYLRGEGVFAGIAIDRARTA